MREPSNVGVLVRVDNCLGCNTCQVACQDQNDLDLHEQWLNVIRRDPKIVDGALRLTHAVLPETDKCTYCINKLDGSKEPLCVLNCPMKCLFVGDIDDLIAKMKTAKKGVWQLNI